MNFLMPMWEDAPEDLTCSAVAPGGSLDNMQLMHPNGDMFYPCTDPAIALLCAETCKTNCWSFPPLRTTKVFLPACQGTMPDMEPPLQIAKDAQRLMYSTVTDPTKTKQ